jgi:hypothetical protein
MKTPADAPDVAPAKGFGSSSFWNVAACAAAFVFTCLVLHAFLPTPNIGDVSSKLRFFATHKDEFDTIFVGSSRIHNGVAPSIFDQVLAENGIPSRTFNFGGSGMYPPEEFHVLEQILALNPRNLKRLFLEIDDVQAAWLPGDQTSQRVVAWHDTKSTWLIVRKILDLDVREPLARKLRMLRRARHPLARHLMLWARNISNQGRAFDLAESFAGGNQIEWEKLGPKLDGHFPTEEVISGEAELAYERELAREQAVNAGNVALDRYAERAYRHYARQIRRRGVSPVFVVAPVFPQFPSKFSGPPPGLVLAYNKPSLYPDFYRSSVRVDAHHLNSTGAIKFSTLIALDFLRNTRQP